MAITFSFFYKFKNSFPGLNYKKYAVIRDCEMEFMPRKEEFMNDKKFRN